MNGNEVPSIHCARQQHTACDGEGRPFVRCSCACHNKRTSTRQYPPRRAHTAIRLDTAQLEQIDALADHSGQTRSDTIRRLIDTGIRLNTKQATMNAIAEQRKAQP